MTMYEENELLQLSGIQHFKFCRRRWALIHIEQQWAENYRTIDGEIMHEKAHDSGNFEARKNILITRGIYIHSLKLGISGQCDVLEFHRTKEGGITLPERDGAWQPFPVEYKRGKPHPQSGDELQLCAQAMCLEEMLCCPIPKGALYYGELRHREIVFFDDALRETVKDSLLEMHRLFQKKYTPKAKPNSSCRACSMKDICLPQIANTPSVDSYIREIIGEKS